MVCKKTHRAACVGMSYPRGKATALGHFDTRRSEVHRMCFMGLDFCLEMYNVVRYLATCIKTVVVVVV